MSISQAAIGSYPSTRANVTYLFTTAGSFANTSPVGYNYVHVEAVGGGGACFSGTAATSSGGGGGGYARTPSVVITGGTTVVNILVGATNSNSWVNVVSNAAPTATSQGCLAVRGTSGAASTPGKGGGQPTNAGQIGATLFLGGNAGAASSTTSGGGSAAGDAANGTIGTTANVAGGTGTNITGGTGTLANGTTAALAGGAPGGGAGASSKTAANGGVGVVRIVYSQWI